MTLEVLELGRQTNGVTVDVHPVASLLLDLIHLEDTLLGHAPLELEQEVLAQTHRPAHADTVDDLDVLVHKTVDLGDGGVDLGLLGSEDGREVVGRGKTLGLGHLDLGEASNVGEQVTKGRQVAALALANVVLDLVLSSGGVRLEGQVVVGELLVLALDGLEELVGGILKSVGDLDEHGLLLGREVLAGTLGHTLGIGLTLLDGGSDGLLHVGVEGLVLHTEKSAIGLGGVGEVALHTGQHFEAVLHSPVVGSNSVGENVETVLEVGLGVGDSSQGFLRVGGDLLGGLGQVTLGGASIVGSLGTDLGDLALEEAIELHHLLGGGALVLVKDLTKLATGTGGLGELDVHELLNAGDLGSDVAVHLGLLGLVRDHHTGNNLDVTSELGVHLLDVGSHSGEVGGELLAGVLHLLGGLLAGSRDVLHGLGEATVGEGSLLGDLVVDVGHGGTEGLVKLSTLVGHVGLERGELLVGVLLGVGQLRLHSIHDGVEASSGLGIGGTNIGGGSLLLGLDLGSEGLHLGIHHALHLLGLLLELGSVCVHTGVGLLDLLLSLVLEGEQGAVHGGNAVSQSLLRDGLLGLDGLGDGSTVGSGLLGSLGLSTLDSLELGSSHSHSGVESLLGLLSHGAHSEEQLLLHLGTGLLGLQVQVLDLGSGTLGLGRDLGGDLHVQGSLGLGVQVHEVLLGGGHAVLTLLHGVTHSGLELGLVGIHDLLEVLATLLVLDGISMHDASEVLDLGLELLVVVVDGLVERAEPLGEVSLGLTEGVLDVEHGLTSLGLESLVGVHLLDLVLHDRLVQLGRLLGEHVGGMGTVLLHGGTHSVQLHGVVSRHGVKALVSGSLVLVNEMLQLLVLLQVLLVAIVTELDHALLLAH